MTDPNDPVPPDTGEFAVQPLPTLSMSQAAAAELFQLLNAIPLQAGEEAILIGDSTGKLVSAILTDKILHKLT